MQVGSELGQFQIGVEGFLKRPLTLPADGHDPQVLALLRRAIDQPLDLRSQGRGGGEIFPQRGQDGVAQQQPHRLVVGRQLVGLAKGLDRLRAFSVLQQQFAVLGQCRDVVGFLGQSLLDVPPQGLALPEHRQAVRALRQNLIAKADQIAEHQRRAGSLDDFPLGQINLEQLGAQRGQEVELVTVESPAAGRITQRHGTGPGGLPVRQTDRRNAVDPGKNGLSLVNARQVQAIVSRLGRPGRPACAHVQAVQLVRFDGRHQHAAVGDGHRRIRPSRTDRLERRSIKGWKAKELLLVRLRPFDVLESP